MDNNNLYEIILHTRNGLKCFTRQDAINNAIQQKQAGTAPHYVLRGSDSAPGWLVYSTFSDGAGVVFPNQKGGYNLVQGLQCDFCYI